MTVSFVRIDDRMIHGQTVTRWAKEYPCDGLIAVNDAAAKNKVLIQAYKGASDKKTFVWSKEAFAAKSQKVSDSDSRYFLISNNQSITQEEADAIEAIEKAGYKVKFQLLPDVSIGYWSDFKGKFGY